MYAILTVILLDIPPFSVHQNYIGLAATHKSQFWDRRTFLPYKYVPLTKYDNSTPWHQFGMIYVYIFAIKTMIYRRASL